METQSAFFSWASAATSEAGAPLSGVWRFAFILGWPVLGRPWLGRAGYPYNQQCANRPEPRFCCFSLQQLYGPYS